MTKRDEHVDRLLDRYRTGELDIAEWRRVEEHLAACEGCRSALATLGAFTKTVERAYAAETTARALEREPDWGRLRAAIVGRTSARGAAPQRSWLARHAQQAALAVLAFIAVGVLWQQGIRESADAERALRSERPAASRHEPAGQRSGGGAVEARTQATRADAPGAERTTEGAAAGIPTEGASAEQEYAARAGAETPPPAAEAIGQDAKPDHDALEDRTVSPARLAARPDSGTPGAEPAVADEIAVTAQKNAAAPPAELERFQRRARVALSEADSALAAGALAQWRDSLASGEKLPVDLRRAAETLADSLATFLAGRP